MAVGVFVTGTDTEIGKTVASAALLHHLRGLGLRCAAMKPVASGASRGVEGLRNDDALGLMAASGLEVDYSDVNPWVFEEATAPHLAARDQGMEIDSAPIHAAFRRLAARAEVVVVEGVGGWLVPLGPRLDVATLAREMDLPIVLVVGLRLGCINHALLSAHAIEAAGCRLAGWIANQPGDDFPRSEENIATLEERIRAPLLGRIPWSAQGPTGARLERVDEAALRVALAL